MDCVRVERAGRVVRLVLNRPERLNVSEQLYRRLLEEVLRAEATDLLAIMGTADRAEGVAAFRDRRTPLFEGK